MGQPHKLVKKQTIKKRQKMMDDWITHNDVCRCADCSGYNLQMTMVDDEAARKKAAIIKITNEHSGSSLDNEKEKQALTDALIIEI